MMRSKLRSFRLVINKGQVLTHYYRLMNKNGGYTWLQTCATVVCSSKNADEQNIICVNYVVSNRENENLILDCIQLENGLDNIKNEEIIADNGAGSPGSDPSNEGPPGASGRPGDLQKSPKSETPEPKSRSRNLSSGTSSALANNGTNGTALVIDTPSVSIPDENHIVTTAVSSTPIRKPHKRKLKQLEVDGDMGVNDCPTKMVSSAMSLSQDIQVPRLQGNTIGVEEHTESSVKELENAMSKHLPSPVNNNNNNNNTTTDFSTDALLKQQQDKSSTIQWIGTHHHNPFHQQTATMPATALLRQLYANRESVIRATARQSSSGVFYSGKHFLRHEISSDYN